MRLIDAEKLEKYKADCCISLTEWQEGWNDAINMIIDETPTVDAEPVRHGHWNKYPTTDGWDIAECSECGHCGIIEHNYCPDCGAKMDGDR